MEKEAKVFKYERPEFDGVKKSMLMCSSDLMRVHVQVVKSGGENNSTRIPVRMLSGSFSTEP